MEELTKIKIFGDGNTVPKVESGIEVFLIQDGQVQVGRLNLGEDYEFNMEIEHPKNQSELNEIAFQIIKDRKPEYLENENSIIAISPIKISDLMEWE